MNCSISTGFKRLSSVSGTSLLLASALLSIGIASRATAGPWHPSHATMYPVVCLQPIGDGSDATAWEIEYPCRYVVISPRHPGVSSGGSPHITAHKRSRAAATVVIPRVSYRHT